VVIVKIDNPRGNYYGGLTAAPVTRAMLEQALASRRVAIDRGRLAAQEGTAPAAPPTPEDSSGPPPVVVTLPYRAPQASTAPRPVPDVAGQSIREAALALHRRGFLVNLRGLGRVIGTVPAAGEIARPGSSVVVLAE
jgi:cell division protein FtsI (penicillin-binding protein 3)